MHTSIYAGFCGLLMAWLALQTIKLRRAHKAKLGDGGSFELQSAIRAHGNFAEYMPITLILLFLLESNGLPILLIHMIGMAFLYGRWLHAQGLLKDNLRKRVQGMGYTLNILIGLSIANLVIVGMHLIRSKL
jgi:uncharacterized protein